MITKKIYHYYIGIDTGVSTGYALWDKKKKQLIDVTSMMIHQAMQQILSLATNNPGEIFVRIEDPRLRKEGKFFSRSPAKLQGVGSVKRDAKMLEDFCIDHKIDYVMVHPRNNKTKMKSDYFKKLTGWPGRTNVHARDAAMLVYAI